MLDGQYDFRSQAPIILISKGLVCWFWRRQTQSIYNGGKEVAYQQIEKLYTLELVI